MRYATLLILASLILSRLNAQRAYSVDWQTENGEEQSGYLKRPPVKLTDEKQLVFLDMERDGVVEISEPLNWVVHEGDTLFIRRLHNGKRRLLQLLYRGEVMLYKVIQTWDYPEYYLVRNQHWERLDHRGGQRIGNLIMNKKCSRFHPPKTIRKDYQAIEVARQINECLGSSRHHAIYSFETYKNQFGFTHNIAPKERSKYDDRHVFRSVNPGYNGLSTWPVYVPRFSASYRKQPFRNFPNLKLQADVNYFRRNESINSDASNTVSPGRFRVRDDLNLASFYFFPGVQFTTNQRRFIQLTLGAGAAMAMPIKTERTVTVLENSVVINGPSVQYFSNFIAPSVGYYIQAGLQLRLFPRVKAGLWYRQEQLEQRLNITAPASGFVYFSDVFPGGRFLANRQLLRWQVFIYHAW